MTQEELKTILESKQINYKVDGKRIIVVYEGYVNLRALTSLPEGTTFENEGYVHLRSMTSLPEGTTFKNKGDVYLSSLTRMPTGTTFKNKGDVYLDSLTSLPEGTKFKNKGAVYLRSMMSPSEDATFENKGDVYLKTFQNTVVQGIYGYWFTTQEKRIYVKEGTLEIDGKTYQAKIIDDIPIVIKKRKGDLMIGNILNQDMTIGEKAYIIEDNGVYAHGKTIEEARESLIYKLSDRDTSAYESMTLETTLTFEDSVKMYRTITGACEYGVRRFVDENNIEKKDRTIKEIIEATKNQYRNEHLVEFFKEGK